MPGWGGHQGNAWSAAATGVNGTSNIFRTSGGHNITALGTSDGAVTITLQESFDKINWVDGPTQVLAGAGGIHIEHVTAAGWVRLKSSANVTVTATLSGRK